MQTTKLFNEREVFNICWVLSNLLSLAQKPQLTNETQCKWLCALYYYLTFDSFVRLSLLSHEDYRVSLGYCSSAVAEVEEDKMPVTGTGFPTNQITPFTIK